MIDLDPGHLDALATIAFIVLMVLAYSIVNG